KPPCPPVRTGRAGKSFNGGKNRAQGAGSVCRGLLLALLRIRERLVVPRRDDIGTGEPTVEIDVSAALGAERLEFLHCGLAADGAFAKWGFAHHTPDRLDWLSQLK